MGTGIKESGSWRYMLGEFCETCKKNHKKWHYSDDEIEALGIESAPQIVRHTSPVAVAAMRDVSDDGESSGVSVVFCEDWPCLLGHYQEIIVGVFEQRRRAMAPASRLVVARGLPPELSGLTTPDDLKDLFAEAASISGMVPTRPGGMGGPRRGR